MRRHVVAGVLVCLAARAETFLIRSADGGRTFEEADPGPPLDELVAVFQAPGSPRWILVGNAYRGGARVYASDDGARSWTEMTGLRRAGRAVTADATGSGSHLVVGRDDPAFPVRVTKLFTGRDSVYGLSCYFDEDNLFRGPRLLRSPDEGRTWGEPRSVAIDACPDNIRVVNRSSGVPVLFQGFASARNRMLQRSADEGYSWTTVELGGTPRALAAAGQDAELLIAGAGDSTGESTVFHQSRDLGLTWEPVPGAGVPGEVKELAASGETLYALTARGVLYRSTDGGRAWNPTRREPLLASIRVDAANPQLVLSFSRTRSAVRIGERDIQVSSLLAPGAFATISGGGLASGAETVTIDKQLPETLAGASVRVEGKAAALASTAAGLVLFQAPYGLSAGPVLVELRRPDGSASRTVVHSVAAAPSIFADAGEAAHVYHAATMRRINADEPAAPGEEIVIRAAGLGEAGGRLVAGAFSPETPAPVQAAVSVHFLPSGDLATVRPAASAATYPAWVGAYDVRIRVPATLAAGTHRVAIAVDERVTPAVALPVR